MNQEISKKRKTCVSLALPHRSSHDENHKSGTVKVHVTESESLAVKSKANQWGVTMSQYIRDAALNHRLQKMIITNNFNLNLLTAHVNWLGLIINHIARWLNAGDKYRDPFGTLKKVNVSSSIR